MRIAAAAINKLTLVGRAGIGDRILAASDDVAERALKVKGPGIGHHAVNYRWTLPSSSCEYLMAGIKLAYNPGTYFLCGMSKIVSML